MKIIYQNEFYNWSKENEQYQYIWMFTVQLNEMKVSCSFNKRWNIWMLNHIRKLTIKFRRHDWRPIEAVRCSLLRWYFRLSIGCSQLFSLCLFSHRLHVHHLALDSYIHQNQWYDLRYEDWHFRWAKLGSWHDSVDIEI